MESKPRVLIEVEFRWQGSFHYEVLKALSEIQQPSWAVLNELHNHTQAALNAGGDGRVLSVRVIRAKASSAA